MASNGRLGTLTCVELLVQFDFRDRCFSSPRRDGFLFRCVRTLQEHVVIMVHSVLSGKKTIYLDGKLLAQEQKVSAVAARAGRLLGWEVARTISCVVL